MSFFPIRDSSGTTQLVVLRKGESSGPLSALSEVPVESTVVIEGHVRMRPEKSRRLVSQLPVMTHLVIDLRSFEGIHRRYRSRGTHVHSFELR